MDTEGDGVGQPGIEQAYVSAESGIAAGADGATTAPDQIYVEFSQAVVVESAASGPVPADGFALDGTVAGVETVAEGNVVGNSTGTGSRVLVLSLSTGITADEQPRLTYRPGPGDVQTPSGTEPSAVTDVDVLPGSPRVLDVSVLARRGDAVRLCFDRPVTSRTDDATMFTLKDGSGNSLLDDDIAVDGTRVTLPLTRDITEELEQNDNGFTLRYRAGGSDTERMHNLAGEAGVLVQRFSETLDFEVEAGGFEILEASVPRTPNGSGVIDRTRLELWFAPPVEAESAAGYELQNSLATVTGLASYDADAPNSPDVVLDFDAPVDPADEPDAAIRYDPERGDTKAAGNETPSEPLSTAIDAVGSPPTPREARLSPDGESITLQFDQSVQSQYEDATGVKLVGAGDVALSGSIEEGERLTLGLTDSLDFEDTDNTIRVRYNTQDDNGRRYNLLSDGDGMPLQSFDVEVERPTETPTVEDVRMPEESRDRIVVRFDRPVSVDGTAGFSLEGPVARVDGIASVDDLDDDLVPYTVVLGLHVDVTTDSATLVYDADEGTVTSQNGNSPESFEVDVEMLPPAPTLERAYVPSGEAEIHVEYDRPVTLNREDATGFELQYDVDRDDLARFTGQGRVEDGTIVLETDDAVDLTVDPTLSYQPDDEVSNVLGADEGVQAEPATVPVEEAESDADDGSDDETSDGGSCGVPTLVDATIPESAPDHVVCEFDTAADAGADAFTVEGADVRVVGVVDTDGETELTLELSGTVPTDATLKVIYSPAA